VLDLTQLGTNLTAEQWYRGLLYSLGDQLEQEDEVLAFWRAHVDLGPCQRFMAAIEHCVLARPAPTPAFGHPSPNPGGEDERRLVLFIDEIDLVRSLPFSTDEFFAAIRAWYNRRGAEPVCHRITFCLLGAASPADLVRDPRVTPFNIGQRIELTDFTDSEAMPLGSGLVHHGVDDAAGPHQRGMKIAATAAIFTAVAHGARRRHRE
jgi:hypothetical protein